jgi:membrane-bound lytic murein transglycosylase D
MAVSAKADVTKVQLSAPENNANNIVDKPVSVPSAEDNGKEAAAPVQSPSMLTVFTKSQSERENQFTVPAAEKDNPDKNIAPFNDDYTSNETALKAIGESVTIFKGRIKERFSLYLERSTRYIDITRKVFKDKNLPEELAFLPIVESGFNPNAYSRTKAVGLWQFTASTGKRYGLVINWWRDERKDPVKSTAAAADYLKDLYKMFGSWNLAIAAYNAGEGTISRALRKNDSDGYWSLLNTNLIRNETKEYVPRYIAAAMIANSPEEYGFHNLDYGKPLEYDEVTISSPLDIDVIAKCAECTIKKIRALNPELRRWSTPPNLRKYTLRIPEGSRELFLENLASIPAEEQFTVEHYTLKKSDTIKKIAGKTGIPASTILAMNSISGLGQLMAGDTITLPPKGKFYLDPDDRASFIHKVSYKKVSYSKKMSSGRHSGKEGKRALSAKLHKSKRKRKPLIRV